MPKSQLGKFNLELMLPYMYFVFFWPVFFVIALIKQQRMTDFSFFCIGWFLLVHFYIYFLPVVAKMEAQSSTDFTARHNNKPGSVISIDMGGAHKDCIYMQDSAA